MSKLKGITDVPVLQSMVEKLWQLLDDIDTADDIAKSNDGAYRKMVRLSHKKRFEVLTSDGYDLFTPGTELSAAIKREPWPGPRGFEKSVPLE